jgi:cation:H+ antiporter
LPELVTAFAAVRLGAFDLAVGNLFGSNAFNMAGFFFVDVAYRSGPLFNSVSDVHAMTELWGILLMSMALVGIIYGVEKLYTLIEPDSLVIILGYCLGLWLIFQYEPRTYSSARSDRMWLSESGSQPRVVA